MVIGDRCPYTWAADEVTWKSVSDSALGMDGPDSRLRFLCRSESKQGARQTRSALRVGRKERGLTLLNYLNYPPPFSKIKNFHLAQT